jgi:hypothetical protein
VLVVAAKQRRGAGPRLVSLALQETNSLPPLISAEWYQVSLAR